jgi:glycosyltransferase involved in cell wall biosynthesis
VSTAKPPIRVLLEMRPALEGHAGIPQETRLLFRALCTLDEVQVEGLLQSPQRVLARGLPPGQAATQGGLPADRQMNRLGRVVISLEQHFWHVRLRATLCTLAMVLWHLIGGRQRLARFDARHFRDYIWRRFFARSLPAQDFEVVTRAGFRIARLPWNAMHLCAMVTGYLGRALYPRLDTSQFDVMISETPYPGTVSKRTRLIVRYHDAIPLLMPHTISDRHYHHAFHYGALRRNVEQGAWFVCVSESTRRDLLSVFPQLESRSLTIHNMVSHDYFCETSTAERVGEIVQTRSTAKIAPSIDMSTPALGDYLLMVSTIEPRKNHLGLLSAWETLRAERYPALKLLVVGRRGWHHKSILEKFRPWLKRGDLFLLEDVPSADLRLLYRHARATVCPSFGEGFDFSGVEAMMSGGAVAASDIAVHREIYADAAEYFNPYSSIEVAQAIVNVIDTDHRARRDELVARGAAVAARYSYQAVLPQWQSFLGGLR